jgi:Chalcone isomerase-like
MRQIVLIIGLLVSSITYAGELNNIKLDDQITVDGKPLVLNGMGLRVVSKFGIQVKVYVAGLYLEKKSSDFDAILKNDEVKRLVMRFVRPVDSDALSEGFAESYEDSCVFECDKKGAQFREIKNAFVSVRKDNEMIMTFYKDKFEIEATGPNAKKQSFQNSAISRNMLAVFINLAHKKNEFRSGLLGLK